MPSSWKEALTMGRASEAEALRLRWIQPKTGEKADVSGAAPNTCQDMPVACQELKGKRRCGPCIACS
jgi:hypothetical protein